MSLKRSPLHDRHSELGAKFAEFGGWEMPVEYPDGTLKEHTAVRERVGIFDVSHLGKVRITGTGAREFVNATLTNDLDRIEPGKAQYTLCCDAQTGGIVDDLIVYLFADDDLLLMPNAANSDEVVRRLEAAKPDSVTITDQHQDLAVIAVQGTNSDEVLDAVGLRTGHDYMSFVEQDHLGATVIDCRTGYTGERGYELLVPAGIAGELWDELLKAGSHLQITPCGLGARDTLRLEMGYPLHGQDLSLQITPNQARLGWAVGWDKPEFWGKESLAAERAAGPRVRANGLIATGRGIPRTGMRVMLTRDLAAGEITSGTFSPSLRKGIGLALLNAQLKEGAEVIVDVRGRAEVFTITRPPFVETQVRES